MIDRATTAAAAIDDALAGRKPAAMSGLRRFVVWTFVGIAVGLVIVLFFLRQANYDPTPTLTPALFEAAHERWKAAAPPSYDIEIHVTGPQASTYRVEVRDGDPQAAWRNGQPLLTRRTFGTWSVPGMFATMSRDVEAIERAAAAGRAPPLILRAEFDAQYGYPAKYRRIDNGSRKGSDAIAVTWDVIQFRTAE
jgi:hypothetical protein